MSLIEIEWKKMFEGSLFSSNFNSQKQGYLILSWLILGFDFYELVVTKSKLFKFLWL